MLQAAREASKVEMQKNDLASLWAVVSASMFVYTDKPRSLVITRYLLRCPHAHVCVSVCLCVCVFLCVCAWGCCSLGGCA